MRIRALIVSVALSSSFVCLDAFAQTRSSAWQGYYVGKANGPETTSATIEADIFTAYEGQALYIDFKITPEGGGEPFGAVAAATGATTHQFAFTYTDAAGRRGRGTVSREEGKLVVRVQRSKEPKTEAADEWTRTFVLRRQSEKPTTNRHPWSLGRSRPAPTSKRPPGAH